MVLVQGRSLRPPAGSAQAHALAMRVLRRSETPSGAIHPESLTSTVLGLGAGPGELYGAVAGASRGSFGADEGRGGRVCTPDMGTQLVQLDAPLAASAHSDARTCPERTSAYAWALLIASTTWASSRVMNLRLRTLLYRSRPRSATPGRAARDS